MSNVIGFMPKEEIEKQQDIDAVLDMLDNLRDAVKKGEAIGVIACALGPDDSTTMYANFVDAVTRLKVRGMIHAMNETLLS